MAVATDGATKAHACAVETFPHTGVEAQRALNGISDELATALDEANAD